MAGSPKKRARKRRLAELNEERAARGEPLMDSLPPDEEALLEEQFAGTGRELEAYNASKDALPEAAGEGSGDGIEPHPEDEPSMWRDRWAAPDARPNRDYEAPPQLEAIQEQAEQAYLEWIHDTSRTSIHSPWPVDLRRLAADEVCVRLALGENLRDVLGAGRPHYLPSKEAFLRWIFRDGDEHIRENYFLARQMRSELYADEVVEIADQAQYLGGKDNAKAQGLKLMVDARKWAAAKMQPKVYGEEKGGNQGLSININTNLSGPETNEDGTYRVTVEAPGGQDEIKDVTPQQEETS